MPNNVDLSPADSNFIIEHNARHVWHPMADPKAVEADPPLIVARADGVRIEDIHGNRYLDCTAGLWNVNVGHNRAEIKEAIAAQLDRIAYYGTFTNTSNQPSIALSAKLTDMLATEGMTRLMFSSGGSDAIETALKLARQYWKLEGKPEKTKVFSLKNAYHGVHFGGLSAGGNALWRRAYEPLLPGFFQLDSPYLYRNPWTDDHEELGEICARALEREIVYQSADTVAAFIAEPVQGAGGLIVPPPNFWPRIREICDRHDILLIADEVVTGFGRTGSMFGSRLWGVKPDIMCFAKGINSGYVPLGATAVNARIAQAWKRDHPLAAIMHGYTYAGHPVACAAALANLAIVEGEDLAGNAARQGPYLLGRLKELRDRHVSVGDVRGQGLMLAIEFVRDKKTKEPYMPGDPFCVAVQRACRRRGAMLRIQGNKMIISPPLVFTRAHCDEMIGILDESLSETHAQLG
jgi:adenosylmethionine-8-amino-7-oxononanoate aminotransferase